MQYTIFTLSPLECAYDLLKKNIVTCAIIRYATATLHYHKSRLVQLKFKDIGLWKGGGGGSEVPETYVEGVVSFPPVWERKIVRREGDGKRAIGRDFATGL